MEEKLISLVQENRLLFDKAVKEYKRKNMREETWERIGKECNVAAHVVKKRWKSLRDHFFRERRKTLASKITKKPCKIKYRYYESLRFLLPEEAQNENDIIENSTELSLENESFQQPTADINEDVNVDVNSCYYANFVSLNSLEGAEQFEEATPISVEDELHEEKSITVIEQKKQKSEEEISPKNNVSKQNSKDFQQQQLSPFDSKGVSPAASFFQSMAILVESSNLSLTQLMELQSKVMEVVHKEISKQRFANEINGSNCNMFSTN